MSVHHGFVGRSHRTACVRLVVERSLGRGRSSRWRRLCSLGKLLGLSLDRWGAFRRSSWWRRRARTARARERGGREVGAYVPSRATRAMITRMASARTGTVRGAAITLDAPLPALDGHRVLLVVEDASSSFDSRFSPSQPASAADAIRGLVAKFGVWEGESENGLRERLADARRRGCNRPTGHALAGDEEMGLQSSACRGESDGRRRGGRRRCSGGGAAA